MTGILHRLASDRRRAYAQLMPSKVSARVSRSVATQRRMHARFGPIAYNAPSQSPEPTIDRPQEVRG